MPEKKKTVAAKNIERRMSKPPVSKTAKPADPDKSASRPVAVAAEKSLDSGKQLASFEAAMKLFHARKLREARELFALVAQGPERDVAQRARLHIAMCDRRLQQAAVSLQSAEDYYNYGVALINTRNLAEARQHLEKALEMAPGSGPYSLRAGPGAGPGRRPGGCPREPQAGHRTGAPQPPHRAAGRRLRAACQPAPLRLAALPGKERLVTVPAHCVLTPWTKRHLSGSSPSAAAPGSPRCSKG